MAKVLVLGGNGFIGSHLVDALVERGHEVRVFDRIRETLHYTPSSKVEAMNGDFLNRNDISTALKDMDYVFHLISTTTPISAENDPLIDVDTNIRGSIELFQDCVEHKIKRVIFASTGGAIYGQDIDGALSEVHLPQPVSPYAIGKLTIEHYLRYFRRKYNLDSITFRISNPYGERQPLHRKQGVIPIFLEHIYRKEPITVLGDGSMIRDYIYIKDVAAILADTFDKEVQHDLYNVGSSQGVSVAELVQTLEGIVEHEVKQKTEPTPSTFVHKVVLDTSRLTTEFGYRALTSLPEGIEATWKYIQEEHDKEYKR